MDFDSALTKVGEFGRAQIIPLVLVTSLNILMAFQQVNLAFISKVPQFVCTDPHHDGEICQLKNPCQQIEFVDEFTSIVSEFKLVCDERYKTSMVQSIYMLGVLFGGLIWGPKSDALGRKKMLMVGVIVLTLSSILGGMSWTYLQFAVLKFINGVGVGGTGLVVFVYATENIGASYRVLAGTLVQVTFALGISACAGVAYYVRDWRHLSFVSAFPFLIYLPLYWVLPQSPRWVASQGRLNQAESLLFKMALKNNKRILRTDIALARPSNKQKEHNKVKPVHYMDFFITPNIRLRMLVQILAWFTCSMVYLGLTMGAGEIGSNAYVSLALSGLVELPAYALCICLLDVFGRRIMLSGFTMVGGVTCLLLLLIPENSGANEQLLQIALSLIGKMAISAAFNIIYIYSSELAPTSARSSALALCTMSARIGGIVAPTIAPYGNYVMFSVFGTLSVVAGISVLLLPETLNQPLPDTIDDIENQETKKRR